MAAAPAPSRLKGFQRPLWRDRVAWLAGGLTIALLAVQAPLLHFDTSSVLRWVGLALDIAVTAFVCFAVVGAIAGTFRGFRRGLAEGATAKPGDLEAKGRALGSMVGRRRAPRS